MRKMSAILLALVMVLSLCSCDDKALNSAEDVVSNTATETANTASIVGKWDTEDGEDFFEFFSDGTYLAYQFYANIVDGTYTAENGRLAIRLNAGADNVRVYDYVIDGGKITLTRNGHTFTLVRNAPTTSAPEPTETEIVEAAPTEQSTETPVQSQGIVGSIMGVIGSAFGLQDEEAGEWVIRKSMEYGPDGTLEDGWEKDFDDVGNEVKYITFREDGSIRRWTEIEYDEFGNEVRLVRHSSDGSIQNWLEYEYDFNGNEVKELYYLGDGSIQDWVEYEYDFNGNRTKKVAFNSDGHIRFWMETEYDTSGKIITSTEYDEDGSINIRDEYEYDAIGNRVAMTVTEYGRQQSFGYEYDAVGNEVKEILYNGDGSIDGWYEHEYDAAGNEVKYIRYNGDGSIAEWVEYEYDSHGACIERIAYDSFGNKDYSTYLRYENEYDTNGNLIKQTEYNFDGSISFVGEYEYIFIPAQ